MSLGYLSAGRRYTTHGFAQAGFRHEGRLREARYVHGHFIDLHYYAVLEEEWAA
jgi:L-amino acid N-acyltransferase YncA